MSDSFSPVPFPTLIQSLLNEFRDRGEIFGIPQALFFKPRPDDTFQADLAGSWIESPLGVAAGPHTQLARNILSAWLCGARFIELKTVQQLDNLDLSKPCIAMADLGFNCEWSQELSIRQSFQEYLQAWIGIHLLRHLLFGQHAGNPGFLFNFSIGYSLEGILGEKVQWFLSKMENCQPEKEELIRSIRDIYPAVVDLDIPDRISDQVTLSTMHGCPPEEIEKIGCYLLEVKGLHTTIKLNPTLLGKEVLRDLLNNRLGFPTQVPDIAFEHDLKWQEAVGIIQRLTEVGYRQGRRFGLKLTNTLETVNRATGLPESEGMVYMSGRALHPISIRLAHTLATSLGSLPPVSFSAGVDCFNVSNVIACGLAPVTVCSDLLKPGGYGRLAQYIGHLRENMATVGPLSPDRLGHYAHEAETNPAYHHDPLARPSLKSARPLNPFDCIHPPCVHACATAQDIPEYLAHTARGAFDKALAVILAKNPFPNVLGAVCDHLCQTRCIRQHYDSPLRIREIKAFLATRNPDPVSIAPDIPSARVAIIGAGPSGLSCAFFLRQAGFAVEVFESRSLAGGMVSEAIPAFRLDPVAFGRDLAAIEGMGVRFHFGMAIDADAFARLRAEYSAVYIAAGARRFRSLGLPNETVPGVMSAYAYLSDQGNQLPPGPGARIVVVGGGNTAIDTARSALRSAGPGAEVSLLYRRSIPEMPADPEEIRALLAEPIRIIEKATPVEILTHAGRLSAIRCRPTLPGASAHGEKPGVATADAGDFDLPADWLILALGQEAHLEFSEPGTLRPVPGRYQTTLPGVYLGGDALRGGATIVKAVGDGRLAAQEIIRDHGLQANHAIDPTPTLRGHSEHIVRRSIRQPSGWKNNHGGVSAPPIDQQAMAEAARCLACQEVCSLCVTVCPNRANAWIHTTPRTYPSWEIQPSGSGFRATRGQFRISQRFQIINLHEFCNECGNCTTFCPTAGAPFRDKARVFTTRSAFDNADQGFFLKKEKTGSTIWMKREGALFVWEEGPDRTVVILPNARVELTNETLQPLAVEWNKDSDPLIRLDASVLAMKVLLDSDYGKL